MDKGKLWVRCLAIGVVVLGSFFLIGILELRVPSTGTRQAPATSAPIPGQDIPDATGYVNDRANVLGDTAELESNLEVFSNTGNGEVAVLTVPTMNGLSVEEFGIRVAEKWKVGKYGKDDGVIILISTGERKARIEVGRGANMTDAQAGQILTGVMVPKLKTNDYRGAARDGVDAVIKQLVTK